MCVMYYTYIKSGLKWCINAQKASPSRHEVLIFSIFTPGYPSSTRLHHNSNAFVPLRSTISSQFFSTDSPFSATHTKYILLY